MRGAKARLLRQRVYGNKPPRSRQYRTVNERIKKVMVPVMPHKIDPKTGDLLKREFSYMTHTFIADDNRRFYCFMKKRAKRLPLTSI